LYYYGARWYDPALGRFLSPDSLIPDPYNSLDWNRYQYVRANPLNWIDPTGHAAQCPDCGGGGNLSDEHKLERIHELREKDRIINRDVPFDASLGGNVKDPSENSEPPNPSIGGIVVAGVALTAGIVVTEILLTWAEVAIIPVAVATPILGVPMEAVLLSCSLALVDIDIAYWSYAARVYQNPNEKQELELLPPWGLGGD
jgi:hypothetical protein